MSRGGWNSPDVNFRIESKQHWGNEYWFWHFSTFDKKPRQICVLVSRKNVGSLSLNDRVYRPTIVGEKEFRGSVSCWYSNWKKVADLFEGPANVTLTPRLMEITAADKFNLKFEGTPLNYGFTIRNGKKMVGDLRFPSNLGSKLKFNEYYGRVALPRYALNGSAYMTLMGGSVGPMWLNLLDIYAPLKGRFMDKKMDGYVWFERGAFLSPIIPWKLMMVQFEDNSLLWLRIYTWKFYAFTLNQAGRKINFIFDDRETKTRYRFESVKYEYLDEIDGKPYTNYTPNAKFVRIQGSGKNCQIKLLIELLGSHNFKYNMIGSEFNYGQFPAIVREMRLETNNKIRTLDDFGKKYAYVEDARGLLL